MPGRRPSSASRCCSAGAPASGTGPGRKACASAGAHMLLQLWEPAGTGRGDAQQPWLRQRAPASMRGAACHSARQGWMSLKRAQRAAQASAPGKSVRCLLAAPSPINRWHQLAVLDPTSKPLLVSGVRQAALEARQAQEGQPRQRLPPPALPQRPQTRRQAKSRTVGRQQLGAGWLLGSGDAGLACRLAKDMVCEQARLLQALQQQQARAAAEPCQRLRHILAVRNHVPWRLHTATHTCAGQDAAQVGSCAEHTVISCTLAAAASGGACLGRGKTTHSAPPAQQAGGQQGHAAGVGAVPVGQQADRVGPQEAAQAANGLHKRKACAASAHQAPWCSAEGHLQQPVQGLWGGQQAALARFQDKASQAQLTDACCSAAG